MVIQTMTIDNQFIFDGHLLGDASIINPHILKDKHYTFVLCSKHKEYLQWSSEQMNILSSRPIWKKEYTDIRTNKLYTSYWIRSLSSSAISFQRNRWYPNGTKIVPQDIELTKDTLLNWFMDDGSLATKGGVYLATDCFSDNDLSLLQTRLFKDLNLQSTLHSNGRGFRIYFTKQTANDFFSIIGSCPISLFSYKWNS